MTRQHLASIRFVDQLRQTCKLRFTPISYQKVKKSANYNSIKDKQASIDKSTFLKTFGSNTR